MLLYKTLIVEMVIENTREILLSQIFKTRKEVVRLEENFEILKKEYFALAFDSLTDDERAFWNMAKNGKLGDTSKLLITQTSMSLSYYFPGVFYSYRSTTGEKELQELGFNTTMLTGIDKNISPVVRKLIKSYLKFDFPEPVPIFLGAEPSGIQLKTFKTQYSKEIYDRLFKVTSNYINSVYEVITLLSEVDYFLQRDEVTLDYLKKNFPELLKFYEDGKQY